ncbi:hypothetical protein A5809_000952 [Enterococcus faecium]|nr:hypothetical protein A5809_000952 [Enterococcus faecium]
MSYITTKNAYITVIMVQKSLIETCKRQVKTTIGYAGTPSSNLG